MCGLPSSTPGAEIFRRGFAGQAREKIFGRGVNDRVLRSVDKVHRKTVGKVVGQDTVNRASNFNRQYQLKSGMFDGGVPDYQQQDLQKRLRSEEAERDRVYRSFGHSTTRPTVLGG